MKKILYPGTFDPIHNGHIDIAKRAAKLFDELEFVVAINSDKKTLFSKEKRVGVDQRSSTKILKISMLVFLMVSLLIMLPGKVVQP